MNAVRTKARGGGARMWLTMALAACAGSDAWGAARQLLIDATAESTAPVAYPSIWNLGRISWFHWNMCSRVDRGCGAAVK